MTKSSFRGEKFLKKIFLHEVRAFARALLTAVALTRC